MTKRGLGRGLDAFFSGNEVEGDEPLNEIFIEEISPNPFQPRRVFDADALTELTLSIKQYGVLQPIVVRKTMKGYDLVAGERRWRAAKEAGLKKVPAVIRDYTDAEMTEIALIENIQRENLNPIEEANAFRRLMNHFGLTQEEVAKKIGRSRSHIANVLRLLNLHPDVQDYVSRGTLTMGQARPLLGLEDSSRQLELADIILAEDLSARDAEELVKRKGRSTAAKKPPAVPKKEYYMSEAEDRLKMFLGTQVKIKPGKMKGRIEIEYCSPDDLERILETMLEKPQPGPIKSAVSFPV